MSWLSTAVSRWRCASSPSAPADMFEARPTTTSFGTNRRSPAGGTPLPRAFCPVPLRPSALGFTAGFVAVDTALRTLPMSELVTELSGGIRSIVEDAAPVTLPAAPLAVPVTLFAVPPSVWSVEPIAPEPDPSAVPPRPLPPKPLPPIPAPPSPPPPTLGTLRPRNCAPASVAPRPCSTIAAIRITANRPALTRSSNAPPQRIVDACPSGSR
jgi:hypothetical protein